MHPFPTLSLLVTSVEMRGWQWIGLHINLQNAASRPLAGTVCYNGIFPILQELHWLPNYLWDQVWAWTVFTDTCLPIDQVNNMRPWCSDPCFLRDAEPHDRAHREISSTFRDYQVLKFYFHFWGCMKYCCFCCVVNWACLVLAREKGMVEKSWFDAMCWLQWSLLVMSLCSDVRCRD